MYYAILTCDGSEICTRQANSLQDALADLPAVAEHWLPLSAQAAELVTPVGFGTKLTAYQHGRRTGYKTREIFPRRLNTNAGKIWILKHHKMGILCTNGRFHTINEIGKPTSFYN